MESEREALKAKALVDSSPLSKSVFARVSLIVQRLFIFLMNKARLGLRF